MNKLIEYKEKLQKSINNIDIKILIAFLIIILAFAFASTILLTFLANLPETTDSYYMLAYGKEMLNTGHIPTTTMTPYGEIPITLQNWLCALVYALAMQVGQALNIDYIAVRIVHILSITILCTTCILIGKKNKQNKLLTLSALAFLLIQYSINQVRPHALFSACLLIICETYYLILNKKEYHKGWITASIIATLIATNIQHLIAISIPLALCGIVVLTPKIPIKEKAKTLPFIGVILLLTIFATPPETGNILNGIIYAKDTQDAKYIQEMQPIFNKPHHIILVGFLIPMSIITLIKPKETNHIPFSIMEIIICLAVIPNIRNQYLACTMASLILLTIKSNNKTTLNKLILFITSSIIGLSIIIHGITQLNIYEYANENYIEKKSELECLNYPQNIPDITNKKIICDITRGSWFKQKGAIPLVFSQSEIYKTIDGTGEQFENQTKLLILNEADGNNKLPKTKTMTDIVYDYAVVGNTSLLNKILLFYYLHKSK